MSRLLFVHAHPDDELLATGVALARYARLGHDVHVLTCTLGDEGEVIPAELRHLEGTDGLAPYRRGELARALAHLGVRHRVLGERDEATPDPAAVAYRDSGMAGSPSAAHPRAWVQAEPAAAAAAVRAVVEELRPDLVVTYDERGGYDHPDHVQTHRVVCAALASLPADARPPLFAQVTPRSWAAEDRAWVAAHVSDPAVTHLTDEPFNGNVVADERVTHQVVGEPADLALRDAALAEHATQVTVHEGWFALSNDIAQRLPVREGYARLDPETGRIVGTAATRADLVSGEAVDAAAFRQAMGRFATGVAVVAARQGEHDLAITVSSLTSVSLDPPLVLVVLRRESRVARATPAGAPWAVSVLAADGRAAAEALATRGRDVRAHLAGVAHHRGINGCALLDGALAQVECVTSAVHDGGDHVIVVGEVTRVAVDADAGAPLLYHRGTLGDRV